MLLCASLRGCVHVQALLTFDLSPLLSSLSASAASPSSNASPLSVSSASSGSAPAAATFPPPSASAPSFAAPAPLPLLARVSGFVQSRYVLRPAFVDAALELAATGSEDCSLRLYHLPSASLLHTYRGHTGTVNAVAAAPELGLLASASDDHTVRLWSISAAAAAHSDPEAAPGDEDEQSDGDDDDGVDDGSAEHRPIAAAGDSDDGLDGDDGAFDEPSSEHGVDSARTCDGPPSRPRDAAAARRK